MRLVPDMKATDALAALKAHLAKRGFGDIEVNMSGGYDPTSTSADSPLIQAQVATYKQFGIDPLLWPRNAGSYPGYVFTGEPLRLASGHFGLGHGSGEHAPDEYYVIESANPKIQRLRRRGDVIRPVFVRASEVSPSRTGGCPKPDHGCRYLRLGSLHLGKSDAHKAREKYRTCHPERSEGSHGSAGDRTITLRAITSFVRSLACARDDEHRGLRVTAVLPMIPCAGNGRCRLGSIKRRAALECRIAKLGLRLEGTALEPLIKQLYDELSAKGLIFHPPCHIGDEWFVPVGIPAILFLFFSCMIGCVPWNGK